MHRRSVLALVLFAALALAAAAQADGGGPGTGATVGWDGAIAPGGKIRYVAVPAGSSTAVQAISTSDGRVVRFGSLLGAFGIPMLTQNGDTGGVSADGKTLVLAELAQGGPTLRTVSHFVVFNPNRLDLPDELFLPGDLAFDAISPHGKTIYLIQHMTSQDLSRYVVRAYDVRHRRLLPGRIADRTQKGWVMQGYALTRMTSDDGRWAYTLYQNPGGYPFIHALDTVRGVAHCIGIPWKGSDQNGLWNVRMTLHDGGKQLAVHWKSGRPFLNVDTSTWRVSAADGSFAWGAVAAGMAAAVALAVLVLLLLRRRRPAMFRFAKPEVAA
ncbi:MAG: hypothetical protein E6G08_03140 [Actinobacteria bacterium]|nr:MAG: hypothetical protein E6G08_03140 [Actinomycetota bacterium]